MKTKFKNIDVSQRKICRSMYLNKIYYNRQSVDITDDLMIDAKLERSQRMNRQGVVCTHGARRLIVGNGGRGFSYLQLLFLW